MIIQSMEYNLLFNIRSELNLRDLTRKWLSEETKIPLSTINGWHSKNLTPDVVSVYKVAKALNVSIEYLLTGEKTDSDELQLLRQMKVSMQNLLDNYDHLKVLPQK